MRLRSLKWHGGKYYLAPWIVSLMPPHTHYVEPYFGGGAVLLLKDPYEVSEVVNDIDRSLTNFWKVLQDESTFHKLYRKLEATPFSEKEWNDSRTSPHIRDGGPDVAAACSFFVFCRQSLSGRMKGFATLTRRRTRGGMNEQASAWLSSIKGLPEVHGRLRRVVILDARPAVEVIRQQDDKETLFYLDPPYLHETRSTTGEYAHEMSERHHRRLLKVITSTNRQGKFMLSGYDSPLYRRYLKEWTRHIFDVPNNAAGGKTKKRKQEVLWCNF